MLCATAVSFSFTHSLKKTMLPPSNALSASPQKATASTLIVTTLTMVTSCLGHSLDKASGADANRPHVNNIIIFDAGHRHTFWS